MLHLSKILTATLLIVLLLPSVFAQSKVGKKSVTLTITRDIDGVQTIQDTTFTVDDASEIDGILEQMGIDEPKENQTLEKHIVIRDIEEEGRTFSFEVAAPKPLIGVYVSDLDEISDDLQGLFEDIEGVYITGLVDHGDEGGAKKAGLKKGDLIISIDGHRTEGTDDLGDAKEGKSKGDIIHIEYLRDGKKHKADVTLIAKSLKKMKFNNKDFAYRKPIRTVKTKAFFGVVSHSISDWVRREIDFDVPGDDGIYLSKVVGNSGAEAAGLERGDVVTEMDDWKISDQGDLSEFLASRKPGDKFTVRYIRDGKKRKTTATLGKKEYTSHIGWEKPPSIKKEKKEIKRAHLGVYLETNNSNDGVTITKVVNGSAADRAGLESHDDILAIDGKPTLNYKQLSQVMKGLKPNQKVKIKYARGGREHTASTTLGSKTVTEWIVTEMNKNQKIDVDVILKEFKNSAEKTTLKAYMQSPNLELSHFDLYPNPNSGEFKLSFMPEGYGPIVIKIFNAKGQIVYKEQLSDFHETYEKTLDISDSPNGIYFVQITQGGKGRAEKLVKE